LPQLEYASMSARDRFGRAGWLMGIRETTVASSLGLCALACAGPPEGAEASREATLGARTVALVDTTALHVTRASAPPLTLGFVLELEGERVQVQLMRAQAPLAAGFAHYRWAGGKLEREPVEIPDCLYVGTAQALGPDGPVGTAGMAAVSSCEGTTGWPTGIGLQGLLQWDSHLLSLAPDPGDVDATDGLAHRALESRFGAPVERFGLLQAQPETPLIAAAFREGTAQETKYVELLVVDDAARIEEFGGGGQAATDAVAFVTAMNQVLANSGLRPRVRIALAGQISFEGGDPYTSTADANGEVDPEVLLASFQRVITAANNLPRHDERMLLSGFDFTASVVGLAVVSGACGGNRSMVVDTHDFGGRQAAILRAFGPVAAAHELGHALGMGHDGVDNTCDDSAFLMSAQGNPANPSLTFSTCSIEDFADTLASAQYDAEGRCLDDVPELPSVAVCGDGVVSAGEQCDCGQANCGAIDPCCNGSTCRLTAGSACSDFNDTCCRSCQVVSAATPCRASRGECDVAETCDGQRGQCPADVALGDGRACEDDGGYTGACFRGECRSAGADCDAVEDRLQGAPDLGPPQGANCAVACDGLRCQRGNVCQVISNVDNSDGVPCANGGQCLDGSCAADACPNDANKRLPGQCGCGVADTDRDSDGTADCSDACPDDRFKVAQGACGCGAADADRDRDGAFDCNDPCPDDARKVSLGTCGCGVPDTDTDGDATPDCNDACPMDAAKTVAGLCGCGELEATPCAASAAASGAAGSGGRSAEQTEGPTRRYRASASCAVPVSADPNWRQACALLVPAIGLAWRRARGGRRSHAA
jgi:hypothetical protein